MAPRFVLKFREIHGLVGALEHRLFVVVTNIVGEADTGADRNIAAVPMEAAAVQVVDQDIGLLFGNSVRNAGYQNGEFIAAQTANRINLSDPILQTFGDGLKHGIPGAMNVGVVHRIEAVEQP